MRRVSLTGTPSADPRAHPARAVADRPRRLREAAPVAVRVSIPGPDSVETPVTGVGLVALPYDRDSVLRTLEQRARTPRPPIAPLESLFAAFRGPFTAYSAATIRLGRLRDSVAATKADLDSLRRDAPAYAERYAAFGRLSDSLRVAQDRADRTRAALDPARREFAARGDSLRVRHAPVGR